MRFIASAALFVVFTVVSVADSAATGCISTVSAAASSSIVTVGSTRMAVNTNTGGGMYTGGAPRWTLVLNKSVLLLNGALDMVLTVNITSSAVTTVVTTTPEPTTADPYPTSTTTVFTECITNSDSSSGDIPALQDQDGNTWTLFPGATLSATIKKSNTKVRFDLGNALVTSYNPVSEYSFTAPLSTIFCDSVNYPQYASQYKCCLQSSTSTYVVYSLTSAVDPVTCTTNTSVISMKDHYMEFGGTTKILEAFDSSAFKETLPTFAISITSEVSAALNFGSVVLRVDRLSSFAPSQTPQFCRQGPYLVSAGAAEPFLVDNWAFGSTSRQIGYTTAQYAVDRQCNGAPLGYYTAYDGNNSDQFSYWRKRTATNRLAPLEWRNDIVTTTTIINGVQKTFAQYFSMSADSMPSTTLSVLWTPSTTSMRPNFILPTIVSASIAHVTSSLVAAQFSVVIEVASSILWVAASSSSSYNIPPVTVMLQLSCTILTSASSVVWVPDAILIVLSLSNTPLLTTWTAHSTLASISTPRSVSCSMQLTSINVTLPSSPYSSSILGWSTPPVPLRTSATISMAASQWASVLNTLPSATNTTWWGLLLSPSSSTDASLMSTLRSTSQLLISLQAAGVSVINNMQCYGDSVPNAWLPGTCDDPSGDTAINALLCAYRYQGRIDDKSAYDINFLQACAPTASYALLSSVAFLASYLPTVVTIVTTTTTYWMQLRYWSSTLVPMQQVGLGVSSFTPQLSATLPSWMAVPTTDESTSSTTYACCNSSRRGLCFQVASTTSSTALPLLWTLVVTAAKLPFVAGAVVGILLLIVASLEVVLLVISWLRWFPSLPFREDAEKVVEAWREYVWRRLPTRDRLREQALRMWSSITAIATWFAMHCGELYGKLKARVLPLTSRLRRRLRRCLRKLRKRKGSHRHRNDRAEHSAKQRRDPPPSTALVEVCDSPRVDTDSRRPKRSDRKNISRSTVASEPHSATHDPRQTLKRNPDPQLNASRRKSRLPAEQAVRTLDDVAVEFSPPFGLQGSESECALVASTSRHGKRRGGSHSPPAVMRSQSREPTYDDTPRSNSEYHTSSRAQCGKNPKRESIGELVTSSPSTRHLPVTSSTRQLFEVSLSPPASVDCPAQLNVQSSTRSKGPLSSVVDEAASSKGHRHSPRQRRQLPPLAVQTPQRSRVDSGTAVPDPSQMRSSSRASREANSSKAQPNDPVVYG